MATCGQIKEAGKVRVTNKKDKKAEKRRHTMEEKARLKELLKKYPNAK